MNSLPRRKPRGHFLSQEPLEKDNWDFSFSGLKTAALNYLNEAKQKGKEVPLADFAASFQWAIIDVLTQKLLAAAEQHQVDKVVLSGGVAANKTFRGHVQVKAEQMGLSSSIPLSICAPITPLWWAAPGIFVTLPVIAAITPQCCIKSAPRR